MISIIKIFKYLILKIAVPFPLPVHHSNGNTKCLCMEIISINLIYIFQYKYELKENMRRMVSEQRLNFLRNIKGNSEVQNFLE